MACFMPKFIAQQLLNINTQRAVLWSQEEGLRMKVVRK
jgi:hypothetical protein